MDVNKFSIVNILTPGKQYIVPDYQRPYKWDKEQAEDLVNDVYDSCRSNEKEYYIGSIICIKGESGKYEVVDGQQRLVTLTLILLQLTKLIEDEEARIQLRGSFLRKDALVGNSSLSSILDVRDTERHFYSNRVLQSDDDVNLKNLNSNERVFVNNEKAIGECLEKIQRDSYGDLEGQAELKKFAHYLLNNVFVVFLEVDDRVSSFRLFNVLNNRGIPLSDADLLKNELLAKASNDRGNYSKIKETWRMMENSVGEDDLNTFLTLHQISEKVDRDRARKKNFEYYSEQLNNRFNGSSVTMSDVFLRSAEHYYEILNEDMGIDQTIMFLRGLSANYGEWLPAFMVFLNKGYEREKFPLFVSSFEKVYVHKLLTNVTASQRASACYFAIEAMNNNESFDEVMRRVQMHADNVGFEQSLDKSLFYDESRPAIINLVKSIMLRIERKRHDDSAKIMYELSKITVEHILPKDRSNLYWKDRFDEQNHSEWLHKLGNLTLLPRNKNSAARNYGFDEKVKAYEKSNEKSAFEITKEVCKYSEWNMDTLTDRHEKLKSEIKALWIMNSAECRNLL